MIAPKGIVVCVGYDDLLALTLPKNARHMTEIVVVTTPEDMKTRAVIADIPNARPFLTDAFYRDGAKFNKGAAIEEGFDALGRDGWILIHDADTMLPNSVPFDNLDPAKLYGARRRMLDEPARYSDSLDWRKLPLSSQGGWPGYFQLFHGSCPVIKQRPWYDVTYEHAGMSDNYFQLRWPVKQKEWLQLEVLHLGPRDRNWYGRVTPRLDGEAIPEASERAANMMKMMGAKGWGGVRRSTKPFNERITVRVENPAEKKALVQAVVSGPDTLQIPVAKNTWGESHGDFEWVSLRRLVNDSIVLASKLPPNISGVAGIPRSGMIPAATIATLLHVPLYQLTESGKLELMESGSRTRGEDFTKRPGKLVVVDDVVYAGSSMKRARAAVKGKPAIFTAVYVRPESVEMVDLYSRTLNSPFLLEWNLVNNGPFIGAAKNPVFGKGVACDFDGVICHDDDSPGESGTPYLVPRVHPCRLIATGRRESHRAHVEQWLKINGVKWSKLEMLRSDDPGTPQSIATHKARHFLESECGFFIESCPIQAAEIAALAGRPVICPVVEKVFTG